MSKRNIAYVKPQEPAFLTRLKNQIGYKEGNETIETKKQRIENFSDSDADDDFIDRESEKPVVVVLKEGDLTAEEAAKEEARIAKEATEAPADLNQRIIFKKRNKDSTNSKEHNLNAISSSTSSILSANKPKQQSKVSSAAASSTSSSSSPTSSSSVNKEKVKSSSKKQKIIQNKLSFTNEDEDDEEEEEEEQ